MSGPFLLVVDFSTPGGTLHDQCVEKLEEIARSARETEPGNSKYAILVPREDDDDHDDKDTGGKRSNRLWVLEEYADQASIDFHTSSAPVQAINAWFRETGFFAASSPASSDAAVPGPGPTVRRWRHLSPDFTFSRPAAGTHPDPYVVLAELDYAPGGAATATPYWRAVVDAAREEEPGTLAYGVLREEGEEGEGDRLCTAEVYESEAYLREVHVPGHAVAANIRGTKGIRTGLGHHVLRKIGGYLYKEG
ncbi:hypothetical protein N3K66_001679 [Trichothecium roseum]|uniref:Uncharacterized protein n=1 Tax=Trichothecium roseum TaxID=47278 RepID=A0ACC0V7F2_9HYPO|nr:hypothetical protein N3K66_001679 [Trichothecium roseum]